MCVDSGTATRGKIGSTPPEDFAAVEIIRRPTVLCLVYFLNRVRAPRQPEATAARQIRRWS
jgi:hypothetical protein